MYFYYGLIEMLPTGGDNPPFKNPGRSPAQIAIAISTQADAWTYSFQGGLGPFIPERAPPSTPSVVNNPQFAHPERTRVQNAVILQASQPNPWMFAFEGGAAPFAPRRFLAPGWSVDGPPSQHPGRTIQQMAVVSQQQPDPWTYSYPGGPGPFMPRKYSPGALSLLRLAGQTVIQLTTRAGFSTTTALTGKTLAALKGIAGGSAAASLSARTSVSVAAALAFSGSTALAATSAVMFFASMSPPGAIQLLARSLIQVLGRAAIAGRSPLTGRSQLTLTASAGVRGATALTAASSIKTFVSGAISGSTGLVALAGSAAVQFFGKGLLTVTAPLNAISGVSSVRFYARAALRFLASRSKDRTVVPINVPRDITTQPYSRVVTAGNASRTVVPTPDLQAEQTYWTEGNS